MTSSRTGSAGAVELLLGPEEGLKAEAIEKTTAALASRIGEAPEIHRFYAVESRMPEVLSVARNGSLFARHRLVIVANAEAIRRKEDVEALLDYMKAPAADATLLLLSGGFSRDIDKKIVSALPKERQKIFWEMFDNQKSGWILNFFRRRGITVERPAVDCILDMVANNTKDLRAECERLALFFGTGTVIALENVENFIYHSKEENVFTLFDRVCGRDLLSTEETLEKILLSRESDATQIASGLLWQFRKLVSLKRLLQDNYEPSEALAKTRIPTKKGQRTYMEAAKKYTDAELKDIILLLAEFDSRFRSVKADIHALLLHLLMYYIVARGGKGAWSTSAC
jgi:DNA polymerase-3 subunit delta